MWYVWEGGEGERETEIERVGGREIMRAVIIIRSPQMSISCWMLPLFSVMSNPRLLMSCCILDIQVVLGRPRFLFDGFSALVSAFLAGTSGSSRIRWPIQEWRRLSIVLFHGSAFVSLYSLAFEITCEGRENLMDKAYWKGTRDLDGVRDRDQKQYRRTS